MELQEKAAALENARDKISRLFKFVQALYEKRNPAPRRLDDQPWVLRLSDVPDQECVSVLRQVADDEGQPETSIGDAEDLSTTTILSVRRPVLTLPPPPPELLDGWLTDAHQDCRKSVEPVASRELTDDEGEPQTVSFDGDPDRQAARIAYEHVWAAWAYRERPSVVAHELFASLYGLYGTLQRESEQFTLCLGDGILVWRRPDGGVRFPLLIRELRLEFDPEVPEFSLIDTGTGSEFYTALFRSMQDVDGRRVGQLREEADKLALHPLGGSDVDAFLGRIAATLSSEGKFDAGEPGPEKPYPMIGRNPAIFLRKRTLGFTRAIESILEDIQQRTEFTEALQNIVGISLDDALSDSVVETSIADANEASDVLFTKPANAEQLQIARNLDKYNCVLVQGPPGTGKTHTIANLLGHLLAQGKSVLVTSHRTKALRVLRDMVVPQLQPLCLSVLDDDVEDGKRLKASVDGIVERLGTTNAAQLKREGDELQARRNRLLDEIARLRTRIREARSDEDREIVVGGAGIRPIDAAKFVAGGRENLSWIPSPVKLGAALPLSQHDVEALYRSNGLVTKSDEGDLRLWIPDPEALVPPSKLARLVVARRALDDVDRALGEHDFWDEEKTEDDLESVSSRISDAFEAIEQWPAWLRYVVNAGIDDTAGPWFNLVDAIQAAHGGLLEAQELLLTHDPVIPADKDPEALVTIFEEIAAEMESRGRLSTLTLFWRKDWRLAIRDSRIARSRQPHLREHFLALRARSAAAGRREVLLDRWRRQASSVGAPTPTDFGEQFEARCAAFVPAMVEALQWYRCVWLPLEDAIRETGLDWAAAKGLVDTQFYDHDALGRIQRAAVDYIIPALAERAAHLRWRAVEEEFGSARRVCETTERAARQVEAVLAAITELSPDRYGVAFDEIARLHGVAQEIERRRTLLERLRSTAPAWARAIESRSGVHGHCEPPGDIASAWKWRQLQDELSRRDEASLTDLMQALDMARSQLREVTADLVDRHAWWAQQGRTGLAQRQALNGWYSAIKRAGKGTGKRAPILRRLARSLMSDAQAAVPVWIMPLVRVAESYDPKKAKFDVVIVDEASQSDVTGLFAFYLADQVIIVGDDEQVSPDAVGEKVEETQHLIDEYLQGIPLADLFDGKQSIYDIARQAFGGTICLVEHFRCVPDIIRFSNALSYGGRIRPLREASSSLLRPATVAYRVASAISEQKVNEIEARSVAALVCAAIERPEYADKTLGVISMVGEEQARRIEELLRAQLEPAELERRRLLSGNAAQFQGDERDVVFLSLVDVGRDGPLPLREQPLFKKRFNVAASRARDQMWVVHSLEPTIDLKPRDLRRLLIEHALDPASSTSKALIEERRVESPFELDVFRRLTAAGYAVRSQVWVGAYRIDMVVEGKANRLAVECDGDRYHRLEDLERDIGRQAILERLGWRFVRIRGSEFYRDVEKALSPVFARLSDLGIMPLENGSGETETEEPARSELREAIVSRAAELLADATFAAGVSGSRRRRDRPQRAWVRQPDNSSQSSDASASGGPDVAVHAYKGEDSDGEEVKAGSQHRLSDNRKAVVERDSRVLRLNVDIHESQPGGCEDDGKTPPSLGPFNAHRVGVTADETGVETPLVDRLRENGVTTIDNRTSGGLLWAVGGRNLAPLFSGLQEEGIKFIFAEDGGPATGNRPGWFTASGA